MTTEEPTRPEPTLPDPNVDIRTGEPPIETTQRRAYQRRRAPLPRPSFFSYERGGVTFEYDTKMVLLAWLIVFLLGLATGWLLFYPR